MYFAPTVINEVFVEIGSSEEHWGRTDAAEVWANVLTRCGRDNSARERSRTVKANDIFPPLNGEGKRPFMDSSSVADRLYNLRCLVSSPLLTCYSRVHSLL